MDIKLQTPSITLRNGRDMEPPDLKSKASSSEGAGVMNGTVEDKVSLRASPERVKVLAEQAMVFDVKDESKIAELKDAIANGNYKVDAEKIASAMLSESVW
jgi:flagellar biosynthesis anti-sigma factor FlgM